MYSITIAIIINLVYLKGSLDSLVGGDDATKSDIWHMLDQENENGTGTQMNGSLPIAASLFASVQSGGKLGVGDDAKFNVL